MSGIVKWLKTRGTHSGLNQTSNSFKMAGYIVAPFIVVWVLIKLFVPPEMNDMVSLFSFGGWVAYIILLYAKAKSDAAGYIPFPQSHWFFPDGQQVSFDLLVPPNGWEQLAEYKDGSTLYRVFFKDKCSVQETDRQYPDVFDRALWKLPRDWNDTFKRNGHGEFFFENLFIDHPACENIEVSVVDWDERESTRLPVAVITGCSYFFNEASSSGGRKQPDLNLRRIEKKAKIEAYIDDLKEENRELRTRNRFLENEAEQYTKKEPRDIKELSDKRLDRIRGEIGDIMDTQQSLRSRLLNLKTFAYVIVIIAIVLLISHFIFNYP